jgi:2-iminobutanoate/2-iminopropanoate deaminase
MNRKVVKTQSAPAAIGPYSQAIEMEGAKRWVFCSGQIPLHPESGKVEATDVEGQTIQVLKNMEAVLQAAGAGFDNVVKTTIFLKSMGDFPKVNEIYAKSFPESPPARSTVEVARLPRDVLVEIECIAVL